MARGFFIKAPLFLKEPLMALTRQQKEEQVQSVAQSMGEATAAVFIAFNGVSLADMTELRDKLHAAGCRMRVVPKRLLKLAAKNAELDFDPTQAEGQVAIAWGGDAVAPAKVLHDFVKTRKDNMSLIAGSLEGEVLSQEQVLALAALPSRDQLLGQLVSVLAGPMRGFAQVLSGVPRAAVYVLQAVKEQKEKQA